MVYVSSAVSLFKPEALQELLARSRVSNTRAGITGLLLYHDGNFMQALEGPESEVRRVFARIEQDPRHRGTIVLMQQTVAERSFSGWAMAFRDVATQDFKGEPGFSSFLRASAPTLPEVSSRAWNLLIGFRSSLR